MLQIIDFIFLQLNIECIFVPQTAKRMRVCYEITFVIISDQFDFAYQKNSEITSAVHSHAVIH